MKKVILLIALISVLLMTTGCFRVISTGEVGVKKTLGKIDPKELEDGFHVFIPLVSWIEKFDVKTQEIKETANVPSVEGLIVKLDISTIYKLQSDKVAELRSSVSGDYVTTLIEPYIRSAVRDTVSGYETKSIYAEEGRHEIVVKVKEKLKRDLEPRGIIVEDVLLRDVVLPETVTTAIQKKLGAEQNALQKEFDLQAARKDAEIRVVEANGISEANKIIAHSLTNEYITYRFVQTLGETQNHVIYVPFGSGGPLLVRETGGTD